jgi:protein phosphatase
MESDVETPLTYSLGFKTDKGQQRAHNEDAGAVFEVPGMDAAFVVCDGMGGLRSGEVASNEAVRMVRETISQRVASGETDPFKILSEAFRLANDAVNALNRAEQGAVTPASPNAAPPTAGRSTEGPDALMGTTGVVGLVRNNTAYIAHAGDSRAYRWRRGNLTRLTEDHTFVAERVKAGDMTEAQARVSKFRNMVIKGIGIAEAVEPDFRAEPLESGDTILVCSDGLTTMLDDAEIAGLMNAPSFLKAQPDRAAQTLVDAANKKGGQDNITVMLMRAVGPTGDTMPTVTLDADAPRPPRRSPLPWILLGIVLALLVAAAVLMFSRPVRQAMIEFLDTREEKVAVRRGERLPPLPQQDYAKLAYDPPERFATYAARGDILSYAPGVGLYFAAEGTGKVALLDAKGKALRSVEKLEIVDARVSDPSATRVFMTSDPQGNVYFSYTKKRMIVKRGPDGKLLRTITGFELPEAIAIDEQGNIFVVDFNEIKVCRARLPRPDEGRSSAKPTPKPSPT